MKTYLTRYLLLAICMLASFMQSKATVHVVEARNFFYAPSSLNITLGDTVRFLWIEGNHPTASLTSAWSTFPLNSSSTQFDLVLGTTGTYPYECVIHAGVGMVGSIVVTASAAPCGPTSPPVNLGQTSTPVSASLQWDPLANAVLYQVRGREAGAPSFGSKTTGTNSLTVNNLSPATSYEWKVRALCAGTDEITVFSTSSLFSTPSLRTSTADQGERLTISGNPPVVSIPGKVDGPAYLQIVDMLGMILWSERLPDGATTWFLPQSAFPEAGLYLIELASDGEHSPGLPQGAEADSGISVPYAISGLYFHPK